MAHLLICFCFFGCPHAVLACGSSFSVSRSPAWGAPSFAPALRAGGACALEDVAKGGSALVAQGARVPHPSFLRVRFFSSGRVPHTPFLRVGPRSLSPALLHAGAPSFAFCAKGGSALVAHGALAPTLVIPRKFVRMSSCGRTTSRGLQRALLLRPLGWGEGSAFSWFFGCPTPRF
jgi:hypothetical protein